MGSMIKPQSVEEHMWNTCNFPANTCGCRMPRQKCWVGLCKKQALHCQPDCLTAVQPGSWDGIGEGYPRLPQPTRVRAVASGSPLNIALKFIPASLVLSARFGLDPMLDLVQTQYRPSIRPNVVERRRQTCKHLALINAGLDKIAPSVVQFG